MIHLQSLISHWHRLNSNILGVFRFPTVFPYRNQWDVCPTGILRAVLRLHFLQKLQQTLAHGSIGLHIPWSNWWFLQEDVWNFCGISAFQMINFMVPWCSMVISWLGSHGFYDPAIPISRPEKKSTTIPTNPGHIPWFMKGDASMGLSKLRMPQKQNIEKRKMIEKIWLKELYGNMEYKVEILYWQFR